MVNYLEHCGYGRGGGGGGGGGSCFPLSKENRVDHVDNVGNRKNDGLVSVVSNWSLTSLSSAEGHPQNGEILGKRRERGGCRWRKG